MSVQDGTTTNYKVPKARAIKEKCSLIRKNFSIHLEIVLVLLSQSVRSWQ